MQYVNEPINTRTAEYLTEYEAALILRRAVGTLRNLRTVKSERQTIPFFKSGRKVLYKRSDVLEFRDRPKLLQAHEYPRIPVLFTEAPIPNLDSTTKLTTSEAALAFGISKASLQIWRSKKQFQDVLPHHNRRDIYYFASDLAAFIANGRKYWKAVSIEQGIDFRPHPRSGRATYST